ncbi:MAG TPA: VanW family protein, partial [Candidatus Caenarcaniphilales bacterium]|nr:VanW family protein [Candidatus Caenarcaniphilales bacterium]
MTTRTDPILLPVSRSSGFPWHRLVLSFLLTLAAVALFVVAFAIGYARLHDGKVVPGVNVAGISLGGLDRAAAEAKLRESLPPLSSGQITVRFGDVEERIRYSEIQRDYDITLMLDQALGVGRDENVLGQAAEQLRVLMHGVTVNPSMTWDSEAVAERVSAVGAQALVDPVDAAIVREGGRFTVSPSVDGQTVDVEAGVERANAAVNNLSTADTTIAIDPVTVPPQVTTAQAQAAVDRLERVVATDLTITGGGDSTQIDADAIRGWVWLQEVGAGEWSLVIEDDPIRQAVAQHALEVDQPATNATFRFDGNSVVAVEAKSGYVVDVEASTETILATLEARADGGGDPGVDLAVTTAEPEFTTEEARALAPRVERLSRWTTRYDPGPLNFDGKNITIPTDVVDGTVVEPGEKFDFLAIIGDITPENGYGPGAAIIGGRTRREGAIGGGMCSCSTTVFNAALHAGLEMGARRNHFYYISRYPLGLDATVWISSPTRRQTMSFRNDMEHAILVRGINRPGKVTFEIWGVPDGRTVSLSEPTVTDRGDP